MKVERKSEADHSRKDQKERLKALVTQVPEIKKKPSYKVEKLGGLVTSIP